ncbi:MAG: membrane protein insertase YidC, partial [Pseudomonadota bacterium]
MEAQDQRNFIIFMVVSILFLFAYQALILEPNAERRREALEAAEVEREAQAAIAPPVELAASIPDALDRDARVSFDTASVDGSIRLRGAMIDDLSFKDHFQSVDR